MAKRKITKEELKAPDAFMNFADKVGQFLDKNWKPIIAVIGIIVLTGIGMVGMNMANSANEEAASAAFFLFEKQLNDLQSNHEKAKTEALKNEDKKAAPVADLNFEKDFQPIVKQFEQVILQHDGTQSADMARIRLGKIYLDYKKYENAINVLEPVRSHAKKGQSVYGLSRSQLASAHSHNGDLDKSIQLLEEILGDSSLVYMHSEVLLKIGVLNKEKGDTDKAAEMFRRVSTEFAQSAAGQAAKNYLKLIHFLKPKTSVENKASSVDVE